MPFRDWISLVIHHIILRISSSNMKITRLNDSWQIVDSVLLNSAALVSLLSPCFKIFPVLPGLNPQEDDVKFSGFEES